MALAWARAPSASALAPPSASAAAAACLQHVRMVEARKPIEEVHMLQRAAEVMPVASAALAEWTMPAHGSWQLALVVAWEQL